MSFSAADNALIGIYISVDRPVPIMFANLLQHTLTLLGKFAAVLFYTPAFLGPGILIAILGGALGQVYIHAQLPIKRLQSNAKAPVLGQCVKLFCTTAVY